MQLQAGAKAQVLPPAPSLKTAIASICSIDHRAHAHWCLRAPPSRKPAVAKTCQVQHTCQQTSRPRTSHRLCAVRVSSTSTMTTCCNHAAEHTATTHAPPQADVNVSVADTQSGRRWHKPGTQSNSQRTHSTTHAPASLAKQGLPNATPHHNGSSAPPMHTCRSPC